LKTEQRKLIQSLLVNMIQIHGKDYTEVPERVKQFHEKYPTGHFFTEVTYPTDDLVRAKTTVIPDRAFPERYFNGHAEESRKQGKINSTNASENCETSAVGRALGMLGIGIVSSIASADEVTHAIHKQEVSTTPPVPLQSTQPSSLGTCAKCGAANKLSKEGKVYCGKLCWKNVAIMQGTALPVIQQEVPLDEIPF
jgi:hypothetical protein